MQQGNTEKRKDKASFFPQLGFRMVFFVLLWRKRLLPFLCSLLCYLFMQQTIQTNIKGKTLRSSRSQMFFKIAVFKKFAALPRKHLSWILFLIKTRLQHRCFLVIVAKFIITVFLQNISCSLYFSEILCDNRILWTSLSTKLTFFIFFLSLLSCPS